MKFKESARILEAKQDGPNGEKIFKVVLITEGLGNLRNKNYYGPEAIESAVKAFEGKWCFLNHQDENEAQSLPERRVQDKGGFYKSLELSEDNGRKACIGELHCDLSETGRMLAEKLRSALKYKEAFPQSELEYVGLSVNGDGDSEPKTMDVGGEPMEVNYVTAITEGDSCDLVTTPARGGRSLGVIQEDMAGANSSASKEDGMKKKLQPILTLITEALKSVKGEEKTKLTEAQKALVGIVEAEGEAESVDMEAMYSKKEGESEADHMNRLKQHAEAINKLIKPEESEAEDEDGDEEPAPVKDEDKDAIESKKDAIKGLLKESGIPAESITDEKVARLAKMTYREAKAAVKEEAKLVEGIKKQLAESLDIPVASLMGGNVRAADGSGNKKAFLEAFKTEEA